MSKNSVNRKSYFLALGFLKIIRVPGDIGMSSVNISGVETFDYSIIYLNCSVSSNVRANVYNLLMFYWHLCLYIAKLLKDISISIVTICCFSWSDCNNPLILTHFCSKDPISRMKSTTLVNACELEHCTAWAVLPSICKQIYYFTGGSSFWPLSLSLKPSYISLNHAHNRLVMFHHGS